MLSLHDESRYLSKPSARKGSDFGCVVYVIVFILTLGTGSGVLPERALLKMIPFLTLLGIWFLSFFVIRTRQLRDLEREIDELKQIEREN